MAASPAKASTVCSTGYITMSLSIVKTLAGSAGQSGFINGQSTAAQFSDPNGIVLDTNGNIYVADSGNGVIRMISASGIVTTFYSYSGLYPSGLVIDTNNNLYVICNYNYILKITQAGVGTILAGSTSTGSSNGIGSSALFSYIIDITIDSSTGNIFVIDDWTTIRKITADGYVSTFASGTEYFYGLIYDPNSDNIYVKGSRSIKIISSSGAVSTLIANIDYGYNRIAIDATGTYLYTGSGFQQLVQINIATSAIQTVAGQESQGASNGVGYYATFDRIYSIAVDPANLNLYVTDNDMVRVIQIGFVSLAFSTQPSGSSYFGHSVISSPSILATSYSGTTLSSVHVVLNAYSDSACTSLISGTLTGGASSTNTAGTATFSGMVLSSSSTSSLSVYFQASTQGATSVCSTGFIQMSPISSAVTVSTFANVVTFAEGVAVDTSGNVYATAFSRYIYKISSSGTVTTYTSSLGYAGPLAISSTGSLYCIDVGLGINNIYKISTSGAVSLLAGSTSSGSTNGVGSGASFNGPYSLAVDSSGNIFVSDSGNFVIRKITSSGTVTTFAGTMGTAGTTDGTGTSAKFNNPQAITYDSSSGSLYVMDNMGSSANAHIRKISSAGVVTTLTATVAPSGFGVFFGLAIDSTGSNLYISTGNFVVRVVISTSALSVLAGQSTSGFYNGVGSSALFNTILGLALDNTGAYLYVADDVNNAIRRITLP